MPLDAVVRVAGVACPRRARNWDYVPVPRLRWLRAGEREKGEMPAWTPARREGKDGAPDERAANTTSFVMRASEQGGFPAPSPSVKRGVRRRARMPDPAMESDGGAMENPDDLPSPSSGCNPLRLHSRARTGGRARRGEPAVPPELAWTAPTRALSGAGE